MRWLSNAWKTKTYLSLVLEVSISEMADALIGNGLVDAKEAKIVARFDQAASPIQCYKCQDYGHMASSCRNETLCAECSHAHDIRAHEITAPTAARACAVCHQEGHTAYDSNCPWKVKEKKRTTKILATNTPLYGHHQQEVSRGGMKGRGEAAVEAASTRRSELDRLEASLRARIEDIKRQEWQPNKAESALIQADLARIRALRVEAK